MSTTMALLRRFRIPLFLFGLTLVAWFPLIFMDFWQDDRALVFKLQHPFESAGLFGKTLWGEGPYRGTAAIVYPLWLLLGLHPAPYFAASILVYFLATLTIFWLGKVIFERDDLALVAASLFAVSHFGADAMLRIINSYQNLLGVIGGATTIGLLLTHFKTKNLFWYFASLFVFALTLEGVFIRSGGLVLAVLAAGILLARGQILITLAKLLPFVLIFNKVYELSGKAGGGLANQIQSVLADQKPEAFASIIHTLGSLVIPDRIVTVLKSAHFLDQTVGATVLLVFALIQAILPATSSRAIVVKIVSLIPYPLWYALNIKLLHQGFNIYTSLGYGVAQVLIGGGFLFFALFIAAWFWRSHNQLSRILLFGLITTLALFLPNWAQYPTEPFNSTHRYLSGSLIGWTGLLAAALGMLNAKNKLRLSATLVIGLLAVINLSYLTQAVRERAIPSKRFYQEFRKQVPTLDKGSVFYFAIEPGDENIKKEFRDFFSVGSMPDETALAIYYGIDRYDLKIAESMDELLASAAKQQTPAEKLYFFRYSRQGLANLSQEFRKLVSNGGTFKQPGFSLEQHQTAKADFPELAGYLPRKINVRYDFKLKPREAIAFAGSGISPNFASRLEAANKFFKLRKQTVISASSQWRFHEVANASDDDRETTWLAHRIHFHDTAKEELTFTLSGQQLVSGLWWLNGHTSRTPTDYQIAVSSNGSDFITVKEIKAGPTRSSGELITENWQPVSASFIRLTIRATDRGDAPEIAEIYAVPDIEPGVGLGEMLDFIADPFVLAESEQEYRKLEEFFAANGLQLTIGLGRKANIIARRPLIFPGSHELQADLPASNEAVRKIYFGPMRLPGSLAIDTVEVIVPPLNELQAKGLIKEFSEN